jgi:hypothetical protein
MVESPVDGAQYAWISAIGASGEFQGLNAESADDLTKMFA